jgi:hypothetical protein
VKEYQVSDNTERVRALIRDAIRGEVDGTTIPIPVEDLRVLVDGEWEYAVRDSGGRIWFEATAGARPGDVKIRRRKAGEWEQVEETP